MLQDIMTLINGHLEKAKSRVRLRGLIDKPMIFLQVLAPLNEGGKEEKVAFFHICKPKKLIKDLDGRTFSELSDLNKTLNESLGKLIMHKSKRVCGKCDGKMSDTVHQKLAIIDNSDKLSLR